MLIQNLQFVEQIDNAGDIEGGASARTGVFTRAGRGFGQGEAAAEGRGNFRSFALTTTGGTATPNSGTGVAGAAASGVDRNGNIAASVDGSVSAFFG